MVRRTLTAIGLWCWQRAERIERPASQASLAWLCGAAVAFGLSTWCRYEGGLLAILLALRVVARATARFRVPGSPDRGTPRLDGREPAVPISALGARTRASRWRGLLADLSPVLIVVLIPLGWLGLQALVFGDPLAFLKATRATIRIWGPARGGGRAARAGLRECPIGDVMTSSESALYFSYPHLANPSKRSHLRVLNARLELPVPEIVSPLELLEVEA